MAARKNARAQATGAVALVKDDPIGPTIESLGAGRYRVYCDNSRRAQEVNALLRIYPKRNLWLEHSEIVATFESKWLAHVEAIMRG